MVFAILLSMCPASLAQVTWYVDDDTCPLMGDGSPGSPFCVISNAIAAASDGDEIIIAEGVYFQQISLNGKAITIRSTNPADPAVVLNTTLDGDGFGPVITCNTGEGPGTVIDGLHIIGGVAPSGGGMLNDGSSPTVLRCVFEGNAATENGAGMANLNGAGTTITDCTFTLNTVNFDGSGSHDVDMSNGGGMFNLLSDVVVTGCLFSDNYANLDGGGMHNFTCSPTVINCQFENNLAGDDGGGLGNTHNSDSFIRGCTFINNTTIADGGGGMLNFRDCDPTIIDCVFIGNSSDEFGGGMMNFSNCNPQVTNCMFRGNSCNLLGGGIFNSASTPVFTNCTFNGNTCGSGAGAVSASNGSVVTFVNSILWGDVPNEVQVSSSTFTFLNTDVQGGYAPDPTVFDIDPMFNDAVGGDLGLAPGSTCIDLGDDLAPALAAVLTDLAGNPRFRNATVDLGAYESNYCPADGDGDGMVGLMDFLAVLDQWGPCIDVCTYDIDADGTLGVIDFLMVLATWGPCS